MAAPFEKKAIFVWDSDSILDGDPANIARRLAAADFETAYLHVENVELAKTRIKPKMVDALRNEGINVIGSSAVYGHKPDVEGRKAGQACIDLGLDGFIFDAEQDFENQPQSNSNAVKVLINFRKVAHDLPVGWCYFPLLHDPINPNLKYHEPDIVRAVMETTGSFHGADYGMPMVYWNPGIMASDAVNYLMNSFKQWRVFTKKPIVPIGRAYIGDGGRATPEAISAFAERAAELGCPGISWWSMYHAINENQLPGVWDTLAAVPKMSARDVRLMGPFETPRIGDEVEVLKALIAWAKVQPDPYKGPELP